MVRGNILLKQAKHDVYAIWWWETMGKKRRKARRKAAIKLPPFNPVSKSDNTCFFCVILRLFRQFSFFATTVGTMSTPVSSSRSGTAAATYAQSTLIIQAQVVSTDHEIIRHIGVDSAVTVAEFFNIITICFDLDNPEFDRYCCNFGGTTLDPDSLLWEHLQADGDEFHCVVGLWQIRIQLIEIIARDNGTPTALCVGGFGSMADLLFDDFDDHDDFDDFYDGDASSPGGSPGGPGVSGPPGGPGASVASGFVGAIDAQGNPSAAPAGNSGAIDRMRLCATCQDSFDLTRINTRLTGAETIETVLGRTRPEPANLIRRSGILDFVPLLQAIDFSRTPDIDPEVAMMCAVLPVEEDPVQQDAFWAVVLGLSCMSDEEVTDAIIESIVQALGWNKTANEVRALCPNSLKHLRDIGGLSSPVERIEIYRELLRL